MIAENQKTLHVNSSIYSVRHLLLQLALLILGGIAVVFPQNAFANGGDIVWGPSNGPGVGAWLSQRATINGFPTMVWSTYDIYTSQGWVSCAINSKQDGSGTWNTSVVAQGTLLYPKQLAVAEWNGKPAVYFKNYYDSSYANAFPDRLSVNTQADGLGTWQALTSFSPSGDEIGYYSKVFLDSSGGNATVKWIGYDSSDINTPILRQSVNSQPDGTGTWTLTSTPLPFVADYGYQRFVFELLGGKPAFTVLRYNDLAGNDVDLLLYTNSAADASGTWTSHVVVPSVAGQINSVVMAEASGRAVVAYGMPNDVSPNQRVIYAAVCSTGDGSGSWQRQKVITPAYDNYYNFYSFAISGASDRIFLSTYTNPEHYEIFETRDFGSNWISHYTGDSAGAPVFGSETGSPVVNFGAIVSPAFISDWTTKDLETLVSGSPFFALPSVSEGGGRAMMSYMRNGSPKFFVNSNADGSGTWTDSAFTPANHQSSGVGCLITPTTIEGHAAYYYYGYDVDDYSDAIYLAVNSAADASGAWSIRKVANLTIDYLQKLTVGGKPALLTHTFQGDKINLTINSAADGSGTWNTTTILSLSSGQFTATGLSLYRADFINGKLALACRGQVDPNWTMRLLVNSAADGSGTWTESNVFESSDYPATALFTTVAGKPAIAYVSAWNGVHLAVNGATDGSGAWTLSDVYNGTSGELSLTSVGGKPALFFPSDFGASMATPANADGSGAWTTQVVLNCPGTNAPTIAVGTWDGQPAIASVSGTPRASYYTPYSTGPVPVIGLEQPEGTPLDSGASLSFGSILPGATSTLTVTIRNTGTVDLTDLQFTLSGANKNDFTAGTPSSSSISPGSTATVTLSFTPSDVGARLANLSVRSNAASGPTNPFLLHLAGTGIDARPVLTVNSIGTTSSSVVNFDSSGFSNFGTLPLTYQPLASLGITISQSNMGTFNQGPDHTTGSGFNVFASSGNAPMVMSFDKAVSLPSMWLTNYTGGTDAITISVYSAEAGGAGALLGTVTCTPLSHPSGNSYAWKQFTGLDDAAFNGKIRRLEILGAANTYPQLDDLTVGVTQYDSAVTGVEGSVVTQGGTFSDPAGNAAVSLNASIGSVTKDDSAGSWSWHYIPPDGPAGPFDVTITATDSSNQTRSATFTLTVTNAAPTAQDQSQLVAVNVPRVITLGAVDPAGAADPLVYTIVPGSLTPSSLGSLGAINGNQVTFSPGANVTGTATFQFTATDDDGATSNAGTVTLNIVSDPPVFVLKNAAASALANGDAQSIGTATLGAYTDYTFTILNAGGRVLELTGTPKAAVSGTHAADFSVISQPTSSIAANGGTTAFTVRFTPSAGGTRTAVVRISNNDPGGDLFAITLTGIGQLTSMQSWRSTHFGTISNSGNTADTADFDNDGVTNLMEFAFGTDPTSNLSGSAPLQYAGTFAGGGGITQTGMPRIRFESVNNGVDFRALFVRRKSFAADGLTYAPQFSANLTSWQSSSATPVVLADDGTYQIISVPYPAFIGGKKAKFFRISVNITP